MLKNNLKNHPCFDENVKDKYARVHLPVALKCNIQCNFCDRRYDCVNESRPGVSSAVLAPGQAITYLQRVMKKIPDISVVGIAGPGDPLANPAATLETLRLVGHDHPSMLLCLATNGLALPEYCDDIARLAVSHVTITVNAIDTDVGRNIYAWVRDGKHIYRGGAGFDFLLSRQIEGIKKLKEHGVIVKINSILTPGINDKRIPEVAKKMAELGADIFNVMGFIPSSGSEFRDIPAPGKSLVDAVRGQCVRYLISE